MSRQPARLRSRPGAPSPRRPRATAVVLATIVAVTGVAAGWSEPVAAAPVTVHAQAQDDPTTTVAPASDSGPATTEDEGTAADDPAQDRLRLIIIGLVVLAVIVLVVTALFWRATSPRRVVTVSEVPDDDEVAEDAPTFDVSDRAVAAGAAARPTREAAFAAALMAPTTPLPMPVTAASTAAEVAPVSTPAPVTPPVTAGPAVRKPDPVEWPAPEPDRLDLPPARPAPAPPVERPDRPPLVVDDPDGELDEDLPDPPRFDRTAEQPAIEPAAADRPAADAPAVDPAPGDWTEWRGIRPLGPVERPVERDDA